MKVYIPKSMIKKSQSMARHNDAIKLEAEVKQQVAIDSFDLEQDLGNPFIESLKVTGIVAASMALALCGFYG